MKENPIDYLVSKFAEYDQHQVKLLYREIQKAKEMYKYQIKMKGGKRNGAGRPKGEPTTTIAFRVKNKHVEELKIRIKELIQELK